MERLEEKYGRIAKTVERTLRLTLEAPKENGRSTKEMRKELQLNKQKITALDRRKKRTPWAPGPRREHHWWAAVSGLLRQIRHRAS